MNKLKVLFLTLLLAAFSAPINAKIVVLNAEVAMLSTQFAQEAFKNLDEDTGFIADRERLELLQAEGQALVEKFQKDQGIETASYWQDPFSGYTVTEGYFSK